MSVELNMLINRFLAISELDPECTLERSSETLNELIVKTREFIRVGAKIEDLTPLRNSIGKVACKVEMIAHSQGAKEVETVFLAFARQLQAVSESIDPASPLKGPFSGSFGSFDPSFSNSLTLHPKKGSLRHVYSTPVVQSVKNREDMHRCQSAPASFWTRLWHKPHTLHDEKYRIVLQSQKRALESFLANRASHFENKFSEPIEKLIGILNDFENFSDIREVHKNYIESLRKAIKNSSLSEQDRELVEELCYSKFMHNPMTGYKNQFLDEIFKSANYEHEELKAENISEQIRNANEILQKTPSELTKTFTALGKQKLEGQLNVNSDFLGKSNVPELRSIHVVQNRDFEYPIFYLRHGNPTHAGIFAGGDICPEYKCFIDAAKKRNQRILYTNHQAMHEDGKERKRSMQIQQLEGASNFFFLSLPFDGPIVKNIKRQSPDNDAEWFVHIVDKLLKQEDGFSIPKDTQLDQIKLLKICQDIHSLYFNGTSLEDRRETFLIIFYHYLKDYVKAEKGISIMVSACKDNKDRGNASTSTDEALYNLSLGKENDPGALKDLFTQCLGLFMIKYEHIIPHRLSPFLNVLSLIASMPPEQKRAIQQHEFIPAYRVTDQWTPTEADTEKLLLLSPTVR